MTASRRLAQVSRKFADQSSARIADMSGDKHFRAQVATVTAGGAADGVAALVTVTLRGQEVTVADYPDSYTPVAGHAVLCVLADSQLSILHRAIGQP